MMPGPLIIAPTGFLGAVMGWQPRAIYLVLRVLVLEDGEEGRGEVVW